ncbi:MAG: DUF922 domain-containing protein [Bacteroidia bacterium]
MKSLSFFLACILFLSWNMPDQDVPTQIAWQTDQPLQWSDFKGAVPFGMLFDAQSFSGIGYSYTPVRKGEEVVIEWEVTAYFDPNVSWVRYDSKSQGLLKHEQGHFDIAEIFTRDMRQKLNSIDLNVENVKYHMEASLAEVLANMQAYHHAYDTDTHHGTDQEQQLYWNDMIKSELEKRNGVSYIR